MACFLFELYYDLHSVTLDYDLKAVVQNVELDYELHYSKLDYDLKAVIQNAIDFRFLFMVFVLIAVLLVINDTRLVQL